MRKTPEPAFDLNPEQQKAVALGDGPALIVAGAGTGKTRVLVERLVRLLDEGNPPESLLALTFTEKAAAEMQDRVNSATGVYQTNLTLMTFNAFGESLLRQYAADIGLSHNFRVMGDDAQIVFLRERIDQLELDYFAPISKPDSQLGNLSDYFSKLKQNVINPEIYRAFAQKMPEIDEAGKLNKKKHLELAQGYETYLRLCREAGVIDYDDQIYTVIELLRQRPNITKELQHRFKYILVDEFQDTNAMQSVLVDALVGKKQNLFVVGDDDQSIYGWRGATLANILDFKKRYPKASEVTLINNYRSTQSILDAAYRLIIHNNPHRLEERLHIDKRLRAGRDGDEPLVYSFNRLDEELQWVAEDIATRIASGTPASDIAILSRRNATVGRLADQLTYAGVEHIIVGQRFDLYREPLVRGLIEVLKAVVEPSNNTSLYHALVGPLFQLPTSEIGEAAALAKHRHASLYDTLIDEGSDKSKAVLVRILTWQEMSGSLTVGQLAYHMLEDSGLKDRLLTSAMDDPSIATSVNRLSEFFSSLKQFEQVAIQPSVVQYLDALPALQAADGSSEDGTLDLSSEVVNVLSIHKSKGLEWPIVYITDCTEGSFPLVNRSRGIQLPDELKQISDAADDHIAEERRLMYVAMTRAKDELILTLSRSHGGSQARKPSRFLEEAFSKTDFPTIESQTSFDLASLGGYTTTQDQAVSIPSSILDGNEVKLTVSQIANYQDCPLDFYYRHILRVPSEQSPSQIYGNTMHAILENLNHCLQDGQTLPTLAELEADLQANWPQTGYLSALQRERALENGLKTLSRLYSDISAQPRIPLEIEEAFRVYIKDSNLSIRGRFDVVFGLGDSVEIVDYKTSSNVDTPEKAKQRASASEQLTLYALAWQAQHDELPALVTLDFIETGQRGSLKKTQRGIDGAYSRLHKVAEGIRAQDFRPGKEHKFCLHPPLD